MIVRVSTVSMADVFDYFTERLALSWIQKYIGTFGGDPTKVMMCAGRLSYVFR
jgi:carboxylesterase type B